ncbi:SGNH/GDSL hydrolase family protein [Puniceicoccus vermicola]|uniref:SGNH/GDSL hydrolase family protein n=1 Tax=Puniceicoccus vermicola TaxID=388746 RepID=A0A7X1E504_9BACT|nr:SGNH/GDSL hydrolase family protein [Puniceicoccus vermicola]MBC2602614.1 SGNH/GDSL hydrolase family protein [Puniceicoccus vermicola]
MEILLSVLLLGLLTTTSGQTEEVSLPRVLIIGDSFKSNAIAERVMARHGVRVNDLNRLTHSFEGRLALPPHDVHYSKAGYQAIGDQVAEEIRAVLAEQ